MTNFSDLVLKQSDRLAALRAARPVSQRVAREGDEEPWWKSALHGLGKVEEITTKGLGQLLTDDPKYNNVFGSSTLDTQVTFTDLFQSFGVNKEHLGEAGPWAAAALGITAAIANPFDPLNKLKIMGLTAKGVAGQAVKTVGKSALKNVNKGVKGADELWQIDRSFLENRLRKMEESLPSLDKANIKTTQRTMKGLRSALADIDENNRVLRGFQESGVKIDELMLADNLYEQSRRGQRKVLGFTSPLRLDQLSLVGAPRSRSPGDHAVRLPAFPSKLDAALVKAGSKIWSGTGAAAGNQIKKITAKMAGQVAETAKGREVDELIRGVLHKMTHGNVGDFDREFEGIYRKAAELGINKETLLEILDTMEGTFKPTELRVAREALRELLIKEPDALSIRAAQGVQLGPEDAKVTPGSRLTEQQKILLTPSGLDDRDVARAMDQFDTTSFPVAQIGSPTNPHEMRLLPDYVVVKAGLGKAAEGDLSDLDGIYGQKVWRRHSTPSGTYLVQRRLPQAVPIGKLGHFSTDHLENMEVIAAQLAQKKKTLLGTITPSDVLVTPTGGVQIINPDIIGNAKSSTDAARNSAQTLDALAEKLEIPMGPAREFHNLKNGATARRVMPGTDGMRFRTAGAASEVAASDEDLLYIGGYDLFEEAGNGRPYLDFLRAHADGVEPQDLANSIGDLRDFERANSIDFHRKQIREQIATGKQAMIEPIEVMVPPSGQLRDQAGNIVPGGFQITNGRNRAAAALMEGLDVIPIRKIGWMGEIADTSSGHYVGATHNLHEVFTDAGPAARDGFFEKRMKAFPVETFVERHPAIDMLSADYKLLSTSGGFRTVAPDALKSPTVDMVTDMIAQLTTRGSGPRFAQDRASRLMETYVKQFGSHEAAALALSEMAVQAKDGVEFLANLKAATKFDFDKVISPTMIHGTMQNFEKTVRRAAEEHLETMASRGVLTPFMAADAEYRKIASRKVGDTVVFSDPSKNIVTFTNSTKTMDELRKSADDFLNAQTTPSEIAPFSKIGLEGADAAAVHEVREFVTTPHPLLRDVFVADKRYEFSEARVSALKAKGILINPTQSDLKEIGMDFGVLLGREVDETGTAKFARKNHPYFITRTGDVILHTADNTEDVRTLLSEVYGEGSQFFQEFGIIGTGRITVSNPLGGMMSKIGKAEVRLLERRLKDVARRFTDMGLSESHVMRVLPPFEESIWEAMYGARTTISDVLDENFKLKIPKNLENHVPDYVVQDTRFLADGELGQVAYKVEEIRLGGRAQEVLDRLRDIGDEQFYQESLARLPVQYYQGYAARNITPEARNALNDAALKWEGANSATEVVKNVEPFFKQRVFTDLTTREINAIIRKLGEKQIENPEAFVSDIIKNYRELAKVDDATARNLYEMAQALGGNTDLFITDPIYTTALRFRLGQQALARAEIFKQLEDKHVLWSGTTGEFRNAKAGREPLNRVERQTRELKEQLAIKERDHAALLQGTPDVASSALDELTSDIDKLKTQLGRKETERADLLMEFNKRSAVAGDIDWDSTHIFIAGEDARRMVDSGVLQAEDLSGDVSEALVKIPFTKYSVELEKNGTRVALFSPEVAQVVDKYFGTTTKTGFTRFMDGYDRVAEIWKSWTLFPMPSYHVRNFTSNLFMASLAGVNTIQPYRDSFKVFKVLRQHARGVLTKDGAQEALESIQFANNAGQVVSGKQIYDAFVEQGGLSGGLHFNEFDKFTKGPKRSSTFDRIAVNKGGLVPSSQIAGASMLNNRAIRGGIAVGSAIENHFRFAAFIDAFQKSETFTVGGKVISGFEAAGLAMKRAFYDYSDLSLFEKSVLRRVLPFYSWSRHNIPRMIQTLATKPQMHYRISEVARNLERGVTGPGFDEEKELPQWVREQMGIVISKREDGSYWVKTAEGFLPMADIWKLTSGDGILSMITNGITPFAKLPIEQLLNLNSYQSTREQVKKLEQFPGQRARSFSLGATGFSRAASTEGPLGVANLILNEHNFNSLFRVGKEAIKVFDTLLDDRNYKKEKGTITTALMGLFIGRSYLIDPNKTRAMFYRDFQVRLNKMKSMHKYYQSVGDVRAAQDTMRIMRHIMLSNAPGR